MENLPHIIIDRATDETEGDCNQDCACDSPLSHSLSIENTSKKIVGTPTVLDSFQYSSYSYYRPSNLYQQRLKDTFNLVFDPLGRFPLTILDASGMMVLNAFQEPLDIQKIWTKTPGLAPDEAIAIARQMANFGLLQRVGFQNTIDTEKLSSTTLTAWLHLTNECNLRCDYCYLHKTHESMSIERGCQAIDAVFRSAIAQSFQKVKLKYAGGESTLEFDSIVQLHDYANEQATNLGIGLTGVVLSNGIGTSEKMIEALRQRNIRLSISLDGVGDDHDVQRRFENGHGSFALVERSLERLIRQNFLPSITITVSQRNIRGLPKVVDYLLERDLPFTINFYRENEHSASFEDLSFQNDQIISGMKQAFARIENNLPTFSILGTITDRARLDAPHLQPCGVGHSYMVIDQNGNVAKCHMEIERKITDISVADPLKVLQLDMVGIQNRSVEEKDGCKSCEWRYYCAGGCPALTHRVTGRYDVKSPNCRIYKAIFPDVLRLEGLRILKYANIVNE